MIRIRHASLSYALIPTKHPLADRSHLASAYAEKTPPHELALNLRLLPARNTLVVSSAKALERGKLERKRSEHRDGGGAAAEWWNGVDLLAGGADAEKMDSTNEK